MTEKLCFEIPYPPTKAAKAKFNRRFGLNAYYAGKSHHARSADARELHTLAWTAMKRAKLRKGILPYPVEVIFRWNDGLDIDNHAVLGKTFLDAMRGYILENDSRRYVKRVVHEFWDGDCIQVEVRRHKQQGD